MEPNMKRTACFPAGQNIRQGGAVLIVSLLVLLVMTIIGVTAMQTTTFEEMMAGNMRDRNMAFQAAETAMRDAETLIENSVSPAAFGTIVGLYGLNNADPDYDSASWDGTDSRAYSGTVIGVAAQPRYYAKQVGVVVGTGGSRNIGVYGSQQSSGDVTTFRITARGVGGTSAARVYLQSYYGKIYQ